jgi:hypothetical protein
VLLSCAEALYQSQSHRLYQQFLRALSQLLQRLDLLRLAAFRHHVVLFLAVVGAAASWLRLLSLRLRLHAASAASISTPIREQDDDQSSLLGCCRCAALQVHCYRKRL